MRTENRSSTDVEALRRYSRQQESRLIRTLGLLQRTDKEFSSVQEAFSVDIDAASVDACRLTRHFSSTTSRKGRSCLGSRSAPDSRSCQQPSPRRSRTYGGPWRPSFLEQLLSRRAADETRTSLQSPRGAVRRVSGAGGGFDYWREALIVPHGSLFYLPFHAFRVRGTFLVRSLSFVLRTERHRISPNSSSGDWRKDSAGRPGRLPRRGRGVGATSRADRRHYATRFSSSRVRCSDDRSRNRRTRNRVVHLVTRAQLRDDNPMFSTVQLGATPVHFFDLYQLKLDADLVAISGCSPSLQADAKGNEIVGLVRGLFYSGARSVLTTLWEVEADTWAAFAEAFYPRLNEGESAESALRAAVACLRESHGDPRHWAPFVLFGDSR